MKTSTEFIIPEEDVNDLITVSAEDTRIKFFKNQKYSTEV